MAVTREQFDAAVDSFQSSYDGWDGYEEYGINDDDAQKGLLSALAVLGVDTGTIAEDLRAEREAYEAECKAKREAMYATWPVVIR